MNKSVVIKSTVICATSGILMVVAQLPTPNTLNLLGACFGLIFMASGIAAFIGVIIFCFDIGTDRGRE